MSFLYKGNSLYPVDDVYRSPTLEQCKDMASQIAGLTEKDGEYYFYDYESKDWYIDKKRGIRVEKPASHMNKLKLSGYFNNYKVQSEKENKIPMDRCYQCGGNIGDNGMVRTKMLILENLPWCRMHCYELWKKKGRPEK